MDNVPLVRLAPAKINLTLAVLGRRDEGFHEIESWVVPIALYDRLTFVKADDLALIAGPAVYSVALDDSNLVWEAAVLLAQHVGIEPRIAITLEKNIPIGAGLGGGSSDAATTLLALNAIWGLNLSVDELQPVAGRLGSDVPLFLRQSQTVIRGRGERVEELENALRGYVVLIVPEFCLPTVAVYAAYASRLQRIYLHPEPAPWKLKGIGPDELMSLLFNDLEPAACSIEPRLAALHSQIDKLQGRTVRMTGSGSTLFSLFSSESTAREWSKEVKKVADATCKIHVVALLPSL